MSRRVVVTGIGSVSPCGHTAGETWAAMVHARSGVGLITRFDCEGWPVRIAAEVKDFDGVALLGRKQAKRAGVFTQYAMIASDEAMADAGLDSHALARVDKDRFGTYVGSGIGGIGEIVDSANAFRDRGYKGLSPFFIPVVLANMANGVLAMRYDARGPSLATTAACATGNHALGEAWRAIRADDADVIIAGGAEAGVIPIALGGFMVMRALSKHNDDPARASKPFDANRDGFVLGEGAAVLVLESLEHATARGARIYAELIGYGMSNDAFHMTAPGNQGAARCMTAALKSARIAPEAVGYINAHGTATQQNDVNETQAIHQVFGDHARSLAVSSTKGVTGHMLGAAGGVEAIAAVKCLQEGVIPPTAHWETRDPDCDLDYVPNTARDQQVEVAISNSFGFGGTNACLVFKRHT